MSGVSEHHLLEALRLLQGEMLADHAADRKTDVFRALDAQMLHQAEHVVGQHVERIRPGGRRALAVAAHVVVEDAVAVLQRRDLRVPHARAAGERMAQDQPGAALLALQFVVDLRAVYFCCLHATSTMRGINISSSCVPPWLPMCRNLDSPAIQSLTV